MAFRMQAPLTEFNQVEDSYVTMAQNQVQCWGYNDLLTLSQTSPEQTLERNDADDSGTLLSKRPTLPQSLT